jgi:ABC-2 type transport system ATP-binding protein
MQIVSVIQTHNLVKQYGRITALKGVSLTVEKGEIFGLLGENGAGKTTFVKVLLGLTRPTSGDASLLDHSAGTTAVRKQVGYLPEDHRFPDYHTAHSLLDFYASLLEVPRAGRPQRIEAILGKVGLRERMHYKIRTYSKGMKQRLGVAQALFHDPTVIFLDEPTDGVDPVGRRKIRDMMLALKAEGRTIFLNSHLLGEVELVCDRVAILRRGEIVREGDVATLTRQRGLFILGLAPAQEFPRAEAQEMGYHVRQAGAVWQIDLADGQSIDPIVDLVRARGLSLRHLVEKRETLEELFLKTVEEGENPKP